MKKYSKTMILNKETAMRLWVKNFGKSIVANDFTGRKIVKGAYNDRNSEFGWNVDHILPQSKGGATADYNLVCCHIKTNDEKADKFPCFNANNKRFEIIKVQNHYEIKDGKEKAQESVNFYDSADAIRKFKSLKNIQKKEAFVGSILIKLKNVKDTAVIDFINEIFDEENITYSMKHRESITEVRATNYTVPFKEDISNLLDKCILLNTYLGTYFLLKKYIDSYVILYQVNHYEEKQKMYFDAHTINFDNFDVSICNSMYISKLVIINTEAKDRVKLCENSNYIKYDYVFSKLKENLIKEVSGE